MRKTAIAHRVRPILLTAALFAAALILARAPAPAVQASAAVQTGGEPRTVGIGPNRAALAVSFGNGQVDKVCVRFTETNIGGDELLTRGRPETGLSFEGAVCSIGNTGCRLPGSDPGEDCFCQCLDPENCQYWAYYQWKNNNWFYSQWGAMANVESVIVNDGDMQAWVWGKGTDTTGPPPPQVTFNEICPAASSNTTGTPTATATPTATPTAEPSEAGALPQVTFTASALTIPLGQCTTLTWEVVGATSITLDGVSVESSGSQRECPREGHTWTLIATNAAGDTRQALSVQVTSGVATSSGQHTVTPLPTATLRPRATTPPPGLAATQRPITTQAPGQLPPTGQPGFTPAPGFFTPAPQAGGGVPLAPTAEIVAVPPTPASGTPTRYIFDLPPTETPRPRRALGADGPTPTPLLIARAAAGSSGSAPGARQSGGAPSGAAGNGLALVQSRGFTPQLLPQYAAYIVTVAALLVMGWFTLRRRHGHAPHMAPEWAQHAEAAPRSARKE